MSRWSKGTNLLLGTVFGLSAVATIAQAQDGPRGGEAPEGTPAPQPSASNAAPAPPSPAPSATVTPTPVGSVTPAPPPAPDSDDDDDGKGESRDGGLADAAKKLKEASEKLEASATKLEEASKKKDEEKELLKGLFYGRLPYNGLLFTFTEKEKRAKAAVSFPLSNGSWVVGGSFSAPLDDETRRAALLTRQGRPLPFQFGLNFSYNKLADDLATALRGDAVSRGFELCDAFFDSPEGQGDGVNQPSCPDPDPNSKFQQWLRKNEREVEACAAFYDSKAGGPPPAATACPIASSDAAFQDWLRRHNRRQAESALLRPVPVGLQWTLGGEIEVKLDQQKVYPKGDLTAKPTDESPISFEGNVVFQGFPTDWLAIPIRAGLAIENTFKAKEVKRCETIEPPTTPSSVSGQSCGDVLMLDREVGTETSGVVEVGAVFVLPMPNMPALIPGLDLRNRFWNLGRGSVSATSATIFVTPTNQPVVTRFGLGVEYNVALEDDDDDEIERVTPGRSPFCSSAQAYNH